MLKKSLFTVTIPAKLGTLVRAGKAGTFGTQYSRPLGIAGKLVYTRYSRYIRLVQPVQSVHSVQLVQPVHLSGTLGIQPVQGRPALNGKAAL